MRSDTVPLTVSRDILVLLILVVPSHVTTFNCRRRCKNAVGRLRTASLQLTSYSSSFSSTMMVPGKRRAVFSRRNTVRMTNQIRTDTSRQTLLCQMDDVTRGIVFQALQFLVNSNMQKVLSNEQPSRLKQKSRTKLTPIPTPTWNLIMILKM